MTHLPHILHIITQQELGGAQRYVLALARLGAGSFRVTVAAGPDGGTELAAVCQALGIPLRILPHLRREVRGSDDRRALQEIRTLIQKLKPDIVHTHSSKAGVLTALALRGQTAPKLVATIHGWAFLEPLPWFRRAIYQWSERIAAPRRNMTIVLSEQEKTVALNYHLVRPETVAVIPNGVTPTNHDRAAARTLLEMAGVPRDAIIFGCVAHFYATKNIPALVQSFTQFAKMVTGVHLVLIGDGKEAPAVRTLQQQLPDRIHLLGTRDDARALMDGFDALILPSVKEGLPFTLLDAMEAGLPVLATAVGGIPHLIADGMNGLLTSPEQLEAGIVHLWHARPQWPQLGAAAQETVRTLFTEQRMWERTQAVYGRVMADN